MGEEEAIAYRMIRYGVDEEGEKIVETVEDKIYIEDESTSAPKGHFTRLISTTPSSSQTLTLVSQEQEDPSN